MSSITLVLGAGFSQALGIPGTLEITDRIDLLLDQHFVVQYRQLRDRLVGKFGARYNFEVLAAALEACEAFGKPNMFAEPYASVMSRK